MATPQTKVESLLAAGALVAPGTTLAQASRADAVCARTYEHPALKGRVVVRLPSAPLADAEDLELGLLGFGEPLVIDDVALRRRRALGFPGWALVNDPKRARLALEVVKELKKATKLAKSKPGHAKEALDAIAAGLARSVPHFLPSFWEEAGRAFIGHGNMTYAASMFSKAREAERVHALKIDKPTRQSAFLEFALAGALSGKALGEYAAELQRTEKAAEAFAQFRELAVRRVLGGMPPWSGMAKDLQRLAKHAGLDVEAEDGLLVAELLEAPAVDRAPTEFWATYTPTIRRVAKGNPTIQAALLSRSPQPSSSDAGAFIGTFLELLETAGALDAICGPKAATPSVIATHVRPAAWVKRILNISTGWRTVPPGKFFEVVRRMAGRLIEEAEPLDLANGWRVELDLVDLALQHGIPLEDPSRKLHPFDLQRWAEHADETPERGRDPAHVAADPRFRAALTEGVARAFGSEPFESIARDKPVLRDLRRAYIHSVVDSLTGAGLVAHGERLEELAGNTSPRTAGEFPELSERLGKVDVAGALASTLRAGVFDELGWPALEEAIAELAQLGEYEAKGTFPYLVVHGKARAIVLGPRGRLLEHDFRLPPKQDASDVLYAHGQLRVATRGPDYQRQIYWSGDPGRLVAAENRWWSEPRGLSVELQDGSITAGGRAYQPGDTSDPEHHELVSDGTTFWQWQRRDGKRLLVEYDPATGKTGRASWPSFFTAPLDCEPVPLAALYPVPPDVTSSALGLKDGLSGWRVRGGVAERIDGVTARVGTDQGVDAILQLPRARAVTCRSAYRGTVVLAPEGNETLWDLAGETGKRSPYAWGTPCMPDLAFWHYFTPRDEAGSRALRGVTHDAARQLLGAALDDLSKDTSPTLEAALANLLPDVRHPGLVKGVVGLCREAARVQQVLLEQQQKWDPSHAATESGGPDDALAEALRALSPGRQTTATTYDHVHEVSRLFWHGTAGTPATLATDARVYWDAYIGHAGALAFIAAGPLLDPKPREAVLKLLETLADTSFLAPANVRRATFVFEAGETPAGLDHYDGGWALLRHEASTFVLRGTGAWNTHQGVGLEHTADGQFRTPKEASLVEEHRPADTLEAGAVREFVELARERGAPAHSTAAVDYVAAETGLGQAQAALLWIALRHTDLYVTNFLPAELRDALGVKMNAAKGARDELRKVPRATLIEIFAAAAGPRPAELYSDPLAVARRLAAAWNERFGRRSAVSPELLADAHTVFGRHSSDYAPVIAAFASPDEREDFTRDATFRLVDGKLSGFVAADAKAAFMEEDLRSAAALIPWVFAVLPVGDPARNGLPRVLELVRARLRHPDLIVPVRSIYGTPDETAPILRAVGGAASGGAEVADCGAALALRTQWQLELLIRPAQWPPTDVAIEKLCVQSLQRPEIGNHGALEAILSNGYTRLAERVRETPVPAGGFEANPAQSVPKLVARAAKKLSVSEGAAALYLQSLALVAPTAARVQQLNGWTPKQYVTEAEALAKAKLLVKAKRDRARRDYFLPGGWEALKAPDMPLETWKFPLYGLTRAGTALVRPIGFILPIEPLHELFEKAWQRIEAGDMPRYEDQP